MAEFRRGGNRGGFGGDRGDSRGGGNRGGFGGPRRSFGGDRSGGFSRGPRRDSGPREMFNAVCDKCGNRCQLPFKPTEGKPVYCSDCFREKEEQGGNSNSRPRNNFSSEKRESSGKNGISADQFNQLNAKLDKILAFLQQLEIVPEDEEDLELEEIEDDEDESDDEVIISDDSEKDESDEDSDEEDLKD